MRKKSPKTQGRRSKAGRPGVLEFPIFVNPSNADQTGLSYARVSLPLPRGASDADPAVAVRTADGRAVPVQVERLASWPDGSPRVLHATMAAPGGAYEATVGPGVRAAATRDAICLDRLTGGALRVTTGRLSAVLGGHGLVESIRLDDAEFLRTGGLDVRVTGGSGQVFRAAAAPDVQTVVETAGPLRTVIALRGKCASDGAAFLDFRLRFEFLAGVEGFSLAYTFFNLERGRDFFDVRAIELELALAGAATPRHSVYQQSYGLFTTLGRLVTTDQPLDIAVDDTRALAYVRNYAALGDEHDYPFYLNPPSDKIDDWAIVSDGPRTMLV